MQQPCIIYWYTYIYICYVWELIQPTCCYTKLTWSLGETAAREDGAGPLVKVLQVFKFQHALFSFHRRQRDMIVSEEKKEKEKRKKSLCWWMWRRGCLGSHCWLRQLKLSMERRILYTLTIKKERDMRGEREILKDVGVCGKNKTRAGKAGPHECMEKNYWGFTGTFSSPQNSDEHEFIYYFYPLLMT